MLFRVLQFIRKDPACQFLLFLIKLLQNITRIIWCIFCQSWSHTPMFIHNQMFVKVRHWQQRRHRWRRRALLRTFIKRRPNFSASSPCLSLVIANITYSLYFQFFSECRDTEHISMVSEKDWSKLDFKPTTFWSSADHASHLITTTQYQHSSVSKIFFLLLKLQSSQSIRIKISLLGLSWAWDESKSCTNRASN